MKTPLERIAEAQAANEYLQKHELEVEVVHDQTCPEMGLRPCRCDPDLYIIHPDDEGLLRVLDHGRVERLLDG